MPVKRDADGNIIDERTEFVERSEPTDQAGDGGRGSWSSRRTADIAKPTGVREGVPTAPRNYPRDAGRFGAPTERVQDPPGRDSGHTAVYRGNRQQDARGDDDAGAADRTVRVDDDPMADPPVGWLTIIEGPGRGHVATLGIGMNSIGRDRTERVSLDYGDQMISRTNHCAITYDPRGRKFYVQSGSGKNLTYVNDEPVLAPREIEPLTHVQMGDTVLRFVPLCGAAFSWEDESNRD